MGKSKNKQCGVYRVGRTTITTVNEEKDLGIIKQDTLTLKIT